MHVASNGREALDVLRSGSTPVDLILTDILMPEVSGMHLMAELAANESLRSIPVVGTCKPLPTHVGAPPITPHSHVL